MQFARQDLLQWATGRSRLRLLLAFASPGRIGFRALSQAEGNRVQPWPDGFVPAQRPGFSGQNDERGLEDIVYVRRMTQDAPAHRMDQRAMPLYQRCESGLIAPAGETLQQLAIGQRVRRFRAGNPAEVAKDKMECGGSHAFSLSSKRSSKHL